MPVPLGRHAPDLPRRLRRAGADCRATRAALSRHPGPGVHRRGGSALHPADAIRQAHRRRRRQRGGRHGRGRAAEPRGRDREDRSGAARPSPPSHPRSRARAYDVVARGLAASPGAAFGHAVFDADTAAARGRDGEDVILVRWETSPDDIHGLIAAKAILTAHGGIASHAALVARGLGKPCVAGCAELTIDLERRVATIGGHAVAEGDVITLDGGTGERDPGPGRARARADQRGPRDDPRLGRRRPPPGGARERGHPGRRGEGARVRRRGDRPLPHRAHVLRRGAPAGRAGDDPRGRRGGAARGTRPAAAVPAERLRGALRGDGRAAGDDPAPRPAAARVPPLARRGDRRAHARTASVRCARRTRCSGRAAAASASSGPRSTRCRSARSCGPPSRFAIAQARRRTSRSCTRSSASPRSCAGSGS